MKISIGTYIAATLAVVAGAFVILGTFSPPTTVSEQRGMDGNGQATINHRADLVRQIKDNTPPPALPKADPAGKKAKDVYKNLKVLGDLDVGEFNRLMASMAGWIAPKQSCAYCHGNSGNFASDDLYTKKVARRMLQMTRHINADAQKHVGKTGVTCYTCHRGQPVPAYVWFDSPGPDSGKAFATAYAGDAALPGDPFMAYLGGDKEIRVASETALPKADHESIQHAEVTNALMIHFATGLGVNCTYCHNTRAFGDWKQSSPQRNTAWHGIRMVRELNANYLDGLKDVFPKVRLGVNGDVPKINCSTCHQGVPKPLLGAKMAENYPELLVTNDVESVKKEEPKKEEPKAEEPKKEAPKAEEPKKDEPKAEEPKKEAPKAEEPKKDEPKAEEPKKEEPKAEEKKPDDGAKPQ